MSSHNPVSTVQADSVSGNPIEQKSTNNAAWSLSFLSSQYPDGAIPITGASGNVAAATATATLAAHATKSTYITGFEITGGGATAASVIGPTVTGVVTGTLTYTLGVVAGATLGNAPLIVTFCPAIPSSAVNTAIAVVVPSLGAGSTRSTVVAHGYQL